MSVHFGGVEWVGDLVVAERSAPRFARESVLSVYDEIRPLLERHWAEIAHFQDVPLDPDYEAYLKAEAAGKVVVFTARVDRRLVGYAVFFLGNLHYKSTAIATQDILFLLPEFRGGAGFRFIRWCDEALKSLGVKVAYHHVKARADFSSLLTRLGYARVDSIFARRL